MAVKIEGLVKRYGQIEALKGIDLEVSKGELFGLIGPDGAGKTSLFRIVTSLIKPDGGKIDLFGLDPVGDYKKVRKIIGYMPERFSLYQDLTVEENLKFFASIFGTSVEENYDLIHDIYKMLEPFKGRRAGKLSGGMKQKLALSCALIHKPELLVLDEPTTGVDAVSRKEFWQNLKKLRDLGITVMVATPYMDEAILCDRVALFQGGSVMSVDSPANIEKGFPYRLISIRSENMFQLPHDLEKIPGVLAAHRFGSGIHVSLPIEKGPFEQEIADQLEQEGHTGVEWQHIEPGIEDCFMQLMQVKKE